MRTFSSPGRRSTTTPVSESGSPSPFSSCVHSNSSSVASLHIWGPPFAGTARGVALDHFVHRRIRRPAGPRTSPSRWSGPEFQEAFSLARFQGRAQHDSDHRGPGARGEEPGEETLPDRQSARADDRDGLGGALQRSETWARTTKGGQSQNRYHADGGDELNFDPRRQHQEQRRNRG